MYRNLDIFFQILDGCGDHIVDVGFTTREVNFLTQKRKAAAHLVDFIHTLLHRFQRIRLKVRVVHVLGNVLRHQRKFRCQVF